MTLRSHLQVYRPPAKESTELKGLVTDFQRFSIHDGQGIRTIVFLKGCPLNCLWCQNPESIGATPEILFIEHNCIACGSCLDACPESCIHLGQNREVVINGDDCILPECGKCQQNCYSNTINICGRYLGVAEVLDEVERDKDFYLNSNGGVTFSGGEPFFQGAFLKELAREAKKRGLTTAVETCGFAKWKTVRPVLPHLDMVLFDVKHMNSAVHEKLTGVRNDLILDNLSKINEMGIPIRVRLPLIPGLNDSQENLDQTAALAASLHNVIALDILPYHRMGEPKWSQLNREYLLNGVTPHTKEHLLHLVDMIRVHPVDITIGG